MPKRGDGAPPGVGPYLLELLVSNLMVIMKFPTKVCMVLPSVGTLKLERH